MLLALEEIGERLTREGETLMAALDRVDAFQAAKALLGVSARGSRRSAS